METLQNNFIKGFAEMVEEVTNNRKITTNQQNLIDSMQDTIEAMQKELDSCKKTITTMSMTVDKIDTIERQVDVTDSKVKTLAVQQQEQGDKLKEIDRELNTLERDGEKMRELMNSIHSHIYHYVPKGTTRDKLFHGTLVRSCSNEIKRLINVSQFKRIPLEDVDFASKTIDKFFTETKVKSIMRKRTKEMIKERDRLGKKIKNFGERKRNSFALLEKFLEDIEGDETRI